MLDQVFDNIGEKTRTANALMIVSTVKKNSHTAESMQPPYALVPSCVNVPR